MNTTHNNNLPTGVPGKEAGTPALHILLADDDEDDCFLFKYALEGLPPPIQLTTVRNGEALMELLHKSKQLPYVLFLDLNMPRKNGMECLTEIKNDATLRQLPVIIFSTSLSPEVVALIYAKGAHYYIRKPPDVAQLRKLIYQALTLLAQSGSDQPSMEKFALSEISYHESK